MEQEFKETAVELNSIFDNMSTDILNKIPLKIRNFFKNNASSTYSFKYDKTKSLKEQNIKDKTRGIIAILYRDYLCNDDERKEYNEIYTDFLNKQEEEKRAKYNPNDIFKKEKNEEIEISENTNYLKPIDNKTNLIKRIFSKIINFFKRQ